MNYFDPAGENEENRPPPDLQIAPYRRAVYKVITINANISFVVFPIARQRVSWQWQSNNHCIITRIGAHFHTTTPIFVDRERKSRQLVNQYLGENTICKNLVITANPDVLKAFCSVQNPMRVRKLEICGSFEADANREFKVFWKKFDTDYLKYIVISNAPDYFFKLSVARKTKYVEFLDSITLRQLYTLIKFESKKIVISQVKNATPSDIDDFLVKLLVKKDEVGFCLDIGHWSIKNFEYFFKYVGSKKFLKKWYKGFCCITIPRRRNEINMYWDYNQEYFRLKVCKLGTSSFTPPNGRMSLRSIMAITANLSFQKRRSLGHTSSLIGKLLPTLPFHLKSLTFEFGPNECTYFEADGLAARRPQAMAKFVLSQPGKIVGELTIKGNWCRRASFQPIKVTKTFTSETFERVFKVTNGQSLLVELNEGILTVNGLALNNHETAVESFKIG